MWQVPKSIFATLEVKNPILDRNTPLLAPVKSLLDLWAKSSGWIIGR